MREPAVGSPARSAGYERPLSALRRLRTVRRRWKELRRNGPEVASTESAEHELIVASAIEIARYLLHDCCRRLRFSNYISLACRRHERHVRMAFVGPPTCFQPVGEELHQLLGRTEPEVGGCLAPVF